MTSTELARRVGRSPSTIDHLRNGRMSAVTPEIAQRIEEELGVKPGTLFTGEPAATGVKV